MMDKTDELLKAVAECILEEEGSFFIVVNADSLDLPLEGVQRLLLGGKATPYLEMTDDGISVGLSINRFHYDAYISWGAVSAIEGNSKAFYCRREGIVQEKKEDKVDEVHKTKRHLSLVKDNQ